MTGRPTRVNQQLPSNQTTHKPTKAVADIEFLDCSQLLMNIGDDVMFKYLEALPHLSHNHAVLIVLLLCSGQTRSK